MKTMIIFGRFKPGSGIGLMFFLSATWLMLFSSSTVISAAILHERCRSIYEITDTIDMNSSLWKFIDSLPVIDTHEHISSEAELLGRQVDIFNLFTPYVVDNLQSAGMTDKEIQLLGNVKADFDEKWNTFYQYYPIIRNTTYFKALVAALEKQYQMKSVSKEEFRRVSDRLRLDYATKGFMQKIMELNRIESILTFRQAALAEVRKTYGDNKISVVPTVSDLTLKDSSSLKSFSRIMEMPVTTLDDILNGIEKLFREYNSLGIRNIKFGSAYNRRLNYISRSRKEAEAAFYTLIKPQTENPERFTGRFLTDNQIVLDDYLTCYMVSLAEQYNMNVIFHIGLAAWNYNRVGNSHASDLEWLIGRFPKVNIVLLHAGYPFFEEGILLAKYYPNVYLNMTWDHIIERDKSVEAMKSYIEMLPLNKIHAFGGDYIYPQQIYGNMLFTRENIYIALSDLIRRGRLSEDEAKKIAYDWLYANPKEFYYRK
jgi:predicted TIM-barrel fold metal-dependent hydrolase